VRFVTDLAFLAVDFVFFDARPLLALASVEDERS
jgi:hypothetical protein